MTAIVPTRGLDTLAVEIRHQVEQLETDLQSAVANAVRAGELLIEAKAQVKHGEWLPWLAANVPASADTAGNCMRLARNPERARNSVSIRAALKQIAARSETDAAWKKQHDADRCSRCGRTVWDDRAHECMETHRRLVEARDALKLVLDDLRRHPPSSTPRAASDSELAATVVHLAGEVQRTLCGEPERDERQLRLDRTQRVIEGKGFPVCNCGARLTEYKGELVCFACSKAEEATA